jgi:hypothetical protein
LITVVQVGIPVAEAAVYLLYLFLAFSEVLVLFAVTIALLAFAVRQVLRSIGNLIEAVINPTSAGAAAGIKTSNPFRLAAPRNVRIPGGHNEVF